MKTHIKTLIVIVNLALMAIYSYGQIPAIHSEIKPDFLQKDFQVLQDSLQSIHAGLYRYKTKGEMDAVFDKAYGQLNHPMSETDFLA